MKASPSTSTLRPSSSELFNRYLDIDGLTYVSDPVQERLRQIEMAHQAKVEALQRQLLDVQKRRKALPEGGTAGRTSDLADEVVCRFGGISLNVKLCNRSVISVFCRELFRKKTCKTFHSFMSFFHSQCSLPESNVSGEQPPPSLGSADEGSWIQVEENEAQPTLWVPDHAATNCAKCDTQFWIANRKHHCR